MPDHLTEARTMQNFNLKYFLIFKTRQVGTLSLTCCPNVTKYNWLWHLTIEIYVKASASQSSLLTSEGHLTEEAVLEILKQRTDYKQKY